MVHVDGPVGLDGVEVVFDDDNAIANAGIVLVSTLAQRLGVEQMADECVDLSGRAGGGNEGAKIMTLISAMALGADCIDDVDVLRAGRTADLLGHRVLAPSTIGTFLRSFTFGHVRQLDRLLGEALGRAWAAGAGPGDGRLVVDVDSFVGEVFGLNKHGAAFGYTRVRGYHPILATRADTGEVIQIRLRSGSANTSRGMPRFTDELIARVNRAGATGPRLLRADSGFWNKKIFARLDRAGWEFSIGIRLQPAVRAAIEAIEETAWTTLEDYPKTSIAQIAETTHGGRRLVVRPRPHPGPPRPTAAELGAVPVSDQPHRRPRSRRSRAPPARPSRARDPRPQGPSPGALPLRTLLRQRCLDGHRRARTQPAAPDPKTRADRQHDPHRGHHPPQTARAARPTRPQRTPLDPAPARPLALGRRLHHRADHPARVAAARLSPRPRRRRARRTASASLPANTLIHASQRDTTTHLPSRHAHSATIDHAAHRNAQSDARCHLRPVDRG